MDATTSTIDHREAFGQKMSAIFDKFEGISNLPTFNHRILDECKTRYPDCITPDHLEENGVMKGYLNTRPFILLLINKDFLIFNERDRHIITLHFLAVEVILKRYADTDDWYSTHDIKGKAKSIEYLSPRHEIPENEIQYAERMFKNLPIEHFQTIFQSSKLEECHFENLKNLLEGETISDSSLSYQVSLYKNINEQAELEQTELLERLDFIKRIDENEIFVSLDLRNYSFGDLRTPNSFCIFRSFLDAI